MDDKQASASHLALTALPEDAKLKLEEAYVVPLADDRVHVRGATRTTAMHGVVVREIFPHLLPLLDGERTKGEIIKALGNQFDSERVVKVLDALTKRDMLRAVEAVPDGLLPENAAHFETIARYFGRNGSRYAALAAMRDSHVLLLGGGAVAFAAASALASFAFGRITWVGGGTIAAVDAQQCRHLGPSHVDEGAASALRSLLPLDALGVSLHAIESDPMDVAGWRALLEDVDLALAVLDRPVLFSPRMEDFNRAAVVAGVPWVSVAIVGGEVVHLGPAVLPGQTACYKCFELRFKSNLECLDAHGAFEDYINSVNPPAKDFGCLPPVVQMAASMVTLEVVRMADPRGAPTVGGRLLTLDSRTFEAASHPVLKIPRCPACGAANDRPSPRVWVQA